MLYNKQTAFCKLPSVSEIINWSSANNSVLKMNSLKYLLVLVSVSVYENFFLCTRSRHEIVEVTDKSIQAIYIHLFILCVQHTKPKVSGHLEFKIKVKLSNVNKNPKNATVYRYLFTANLLYMFRVSQHPSSGVL